MNIELSDKLIAIFSTPNTIKIEKVKRTHGEKKFFKYIWEINGVKTTNWGGFDTLESCIDNCLEWIVIKSLQ